MEKRNRNYILSAIAFLICGIALILLGLKEPRIGFRLDTLQPFIIDSEIWLVLGFVALITGVYRLIVGLKIIELV